MVGAFSRVLQLCAPDKAGGGAIRPEFLLLPLLRRLYKQGQETLSLTRASPGAVADCLHELSRGDWSEELQRGLLVVLVPNVRRSCAASPSGRDVAMALYGVGHSVSSAETKSLLATLPGYVDAGPEELTAQDVASSLFGLGSHWSSPVSVRAIHGVLARRVARCSGAFGAQELVSASYGLARCSDTFETRGILEAMGSAVRHTPKGSISAVGLSLCLYSLHRHANTLRAIQFVRRLDPHFEACRDGLPGKYCGLALYGLNLREDTAVGSMLAALVPLVRGSS
eukprot:Hpha_TRINITY_DN15726_c3_g1::TRINITY_DN15726_c3_g1_i2::g.40273::m.40273